MECERKTEKKGDSKDFDLSNLKGKVFLTEIEKMAGRSGVGRQGGQF